jgi:hypothetical protein
MKHLQEKTGFICLKLKNIERFLSLISVIQTLFCFRRSEEEQLLLESFRKS